MTNAGVTTAYTYPAGSHRLDKMGAAARSYDAAGNTIKIGGNVKQFTYDSTCRMTQVKTNGTLTRQYEYNAKGEQVRSYLDADSAYFVYDEAGHLLGEYGNDGAPKQQLLWFGDLSVGVLAGSGASQKLHYIEPDHLGTPRAIIDGTRNVAIWEWKLTGEAFGSTPPNQDPDQDGTAFKFDLRFPGQRYDAATGMNYNYFRDYDPATGRYVQSDPIGLNGGINTYTYTSGQPLMFFDSKGLCSCIPVKTKSGYQGTGHYIDARNVWGGIRNKRVLSCLYRCTGNNGTTQYVRGTHEEMYWGDMTLDEGTEGVCLGTTFDKPEFNPFTRKLMYSQAGAAEFDPRKGDGRGFKSLQLVQWANNYCKDCK